MSSSKGICKECGVCYLVEVNVQQEECNPPCYEQENSDIKNTATIDMQDIESENTLTLFSQY